MRLLDVRPGLYRDSVRLMQISATLAALPGVEHALVAMATGVNLDLLPRLGFAPPAEAGPDDLMVALVATDDGAMAGVLDRLEAELAQAPTTVESAAPDAVEPRTTGSAVRRAGATLALVSTPGRYAFVEAMDALEAGASVLVFSDNVPVAQEVALKQAAARRGLLVMGPDCGTAVLGGVGLGFANVVRPGPVGLVAASGTGAQQVMCLLAAAGVGVSHCLGVGGRDLTGSVAGAATHAALDLLDADPATELIVLVSKPPAAEVARAVDEHVARLATPVVLATLGPEADDLAAATATAVSTLEHKVPPWPSWPSAAPGTPPPGRFLRGLYTGGSLATEAVFIASAALGTSGARVTSNLQPGAAAPEQPEQPGLAGQSGLAEAAPLRAARWGVPDGHPDGRAGPQWSVPGGHWVMDLGADEFTAGRPHPMIDPGPRLGRIADQAADPYAGVLVLDVVLGHGAHPDPAAELAPVIASARAARPDLAFVVSLIGTPDDPQGLDRQAQALSAAGADVYAANADAVRRAVALIQGGSR